ncbi:thiamine-phosphate kinase [uncultured Methylophaga sp.]|uniref:thiamine-phosphate kinase n=1 Tax=uncultured Methylophaga sp. TaxID=285271 RepID=UPI002612F7E9|nr:thiamine-phosphate kinase [uncultured Methylophaga sp.]
MALSEFSLIERYFSRLTGHRDDVTLGIGDDCALLQCPPGKEIAVSMDTLVEGVHFFADVSPEALGFKSLAVNLSDLASMGAEPAWFTLALTLPDSDDNWLQGFASGLARAAAEHNIQLVGGDTTRGPRTISIQVHGLVEQGHALRRDAAKVGDKIYVTGSLGDAGAALKQRLENWTPPELNAQDRQYLQERLEYPAPRNHLINIIGQYVNAAIDISDGLLADLGHILERSGKGAEIQTALLPLSPSLKKLPAELARELALTAGDDYELCFTVPAGLAPALEQDCKLVTCIGEITDTNSLILKDQSGKDITLNAKQGYDHFSA